MSTPEVTSTSEKVTQGKIQDNKTEAQKAKDAYIQLQKQREKE